MCTLFDAASLVTNLPASTQTNTHTSTHEHTRAHTHTHTHKHTHATQSHTASTLSPHPVLLHNVPAAPRVRVRGRGAKDDDSGAVEQGAVGQVGVPRDPAAVGGAPGRWAGELNGVCVCVCVCVWCGVWCVYDVCVFVGLRARALGLFDARSMLSALARAFV